MEQATLTYAETANWAAALAGGLAARGIQRGDRVAIVSTNRPEMIALWLACLQVGACFCPINPGFTAGQLANVLRRMTPSLIVAQPSAVGAVVEGITRCRGRGAGRGARADPAGLERLAGPRTAGRRPGLGGRARG